MIEAKTFELRDVMTFIPALGVRIAPSDVPSDSADRYLMVRAGYHSSALVLLTRLDGGHAYYDPYDWESHTWRVAHEYIQKHWSELESGSVIDVEFISGSTVAPKVSERVEDPMAWNLLKALLP